MNARRIGIAGTVGAAAWLQAGCAIQSYEDPAMLAAIDGQSELSLGVLSEEPWEFNRFGGRVMRTEHFRIYTTERTPQLRERVAKFLELAIRHYTSAIVELPMPEEKLDVYLMDTRPQWQQLTQALMGERAESITLIMRGGYAARGIGVYYDLGVRDTLAIAGHEGWHQLVQRTFREPLPVWLDEGAATYMEGFRTRGGDYVFSAWSNMERYDTLREMVSVDETQLYSLGELVTLRPGDLAGGAEEPLLQYYAQVWALMHFLREGGGGAYEGALQAMLLDARYGRLRDRLVEAYGPARANAALASRTGPDVFAAYLGKTPEALEDEYRAFLRGITQPGVREFVVRGESPIAGLSGRRR